MFPREPGTGGVRESLRVLMELSPAQPAHTTQPLLTAAIESARIVVALADRKSDTLLLALSSDEYDQPLVLKVYDEMHPGQGRSIGRASREADALLRLEQADVCVPGLVASGERALLRRYVEGPVVRDLHWDVALARRLAEWVFRCHSALSVGAIDAASVHRAAHASGDAHASGAAHASSDADTTGPAHHGLGRSWLVGDMNLGNFVLDVASGRLCGIDLGDTMIGDPLDDVGEGCMRIIGRRPGFTADRWACALAFASWYGRLATDVRYVLSEVPKRASASFRKMAVWRSDPFMAEIADAFPVLWREALLSLEMSTTASETAGPPQDGGCLLSR